MTDTLSRWRNGLAKTSKSTFGRVASLLGATEITEETWDDLEALLIQADLGIATATDIIETLQRHTRDLGLLRSDELKIALRAELRSRLDEEQEFVLAESAPSVILLVGVNGSGKTTTVAKLGARFISQGKKILFGAADTFRAAAVEQLQVWGQRLSIDVIAGQPESDPGAVAYTTVQAGIARSADVILIDTAGRLHTRFNLMQELEKVERVVGKALSGAPHAVWLVMDTTTGQNALQQARAFKESVSVTGVILTKLDSSARGGMVFAIRHELDLPILFAGLGEKTEDLEIFNPDAFIDGILAEF
ncbi:MAG: signal recognition particle-docking protein FtsY [Anaerolineae bacterium]|jgi:fused signal recognition particle receptor|nr:signal recognition particle-docking protein FtsY [Anaerolineae bacterium]MBT3711764.1 signal recognition particle-docking protein FtsY [Anaerolineae bacterium]MBT4308816.1 signal recognition particle-docking protein FtsY [Anaerolineae bacterium]MBT4459707.1 signal recognition particle-docking protein FtsY [Anaerolineae bacterium]MBT6059850.1 signal recognition particle-docking protein FtsY [Anaerolineae bacterium]